MASCGSVLFGGGVRQFRQFGLVAGEAGALEVEAGNLALEFAHRPVTPSALDLVEGAFEGIVDGRQQFEVGV